MGTRTAAGVQPVAKILVVDDDPLVRFVTADHLQDAGFEVVEAPSADGALPLLEAGDGIAALVTDVQMPGSMNGLELAQIVRRRWPGPVPQFDREAIGAVVREELTSAGVLKGVR